MVHLLLKFLVWTGDFGAEPRGPAAEVEAEAEARAAEARAEEPMAEVVAAMSRFMALRIVYGGRMPKK